MYVRLDTPVFTFKSFLDDNNEVSPLFRLRRFSADGRNGPKPAAGEFVHDAKLFAIVLFGQSVFGNISVSLFLLLVAGYMLKDRIKDIFRELFVRSIGRRFFDRRKNIYASHDGKMIAQLRERVAFVREENADAEMVRVRDKAPFEGSNPHRAVASNQPPPVHGRYGKLPRLDSNQRPSG